MEGHHAGDRSSSTAVVNRGADRVAALGALLLTGYLGGATAVNVRAGDPVFETIFPVLFAVPIWAGLILRDARLRVLLPLRQ